MMYEVVWSEWEGFVKEEIIIWNQFYRFWIQYSISEDIPIHVIRYEGMTNDNDIKAVFRDVLRFLLGYDNVDNFYNKRIDYYLKNRKILYEPRKGTVLHSMKNYNDNQKSFFIESSVENFIYFKYDLLFHDLIAKYGHRELYKDKETYINSDFIYQNELILKKVCVNDIYTKEAIEIPKKSKQSCLLNSEVNTLVDSDGGHRSGPRIGRLANLNKTDIKFLLPEKLEEKNLKNKENKTEIRRNSNDFNNSNQKAALIQNDTINLSLNKAASHTTQAKSRTHLSLDKNTSKY